MNPTTLSIFGASLVAVVFCLIVPPALWGGGFVNQPDTGPQTIAVTFEEKPVFEALEKIAKVTGVALAEKRKLPGAATPLKRDGSRNKFLAKIEQHRRELVDLAKAELQNELALSDARHQGQNKLALSRRLVTKQMALSGQAARYVEAMNMSLGFVKSGFKMIADNPSDWEGRICSPRRICVVVNPITALFIILQQDDLRGANL